MRWAMILLSFLFLAGPSPVRALDSFRCGSELILRGNTTVETQISCGDPSFKEVLNPGFKGPRVENWFYDCGFGGWLYLLRFIEGRLQDVKIEGYGRGQSDCTGPEQR